MANRNEFYNENETRIRHVLCDTHPDDPKEGKKALMKVLLAYNQLYRLTQIIYNYGTNPLFWTQDRSYGRMHPVVREAWEELEPIDADSASVAAGKVEACTGKFSSILESFSEEHAQKLGTRDMQIAKTEILRRLSACQDPSRVEAMAWGELDPNGEDEDRLKPVAKAYYRDRETARRPETRERNIENKVRKCLESVRKEWQKVLEWAEGVREETAKRLAKEERIRRSGARGSEKKADKERNRRTEWFNKRMAEIESKLDAMAEFPILTRMGEWNALPSTIRRNCMNSAAGSVRSYRSNKENWKEAEDERKDRLARAVAEVAALPPNSAKAYQRIAHWVEDEYSRNPAKFVSKRYKNDKYVSLLLELEAEETGRKKRKGKRAYAILKRNEWLDRADELAEEVIAGHVSKKNAPTLGLADPKKLSQPLLLDGLENGIKRLELMASDDCDRSGMARAPSGTGAYVEFPGMNGSVVSIATDGFGTQLARRDVRAVEAQKLKQGKAERPLTNAGEPLKGKWRCLRETASPSLKITESTVSLTLKKERKAKGPLLVGVDMTLAGSLAVAYGREDGGRVGTKHIVPKNHGELLVARRLNYKRRRQQSSASKQGKTKSQGFQRAINNKKDLEMRRAANSVVSQLVDLGARTFVMENWDLRPSLRSSRSQNRIMGEYSPQRWKRELEYQAVKAGMRVLKVNPSYTSQLCHSCCQKGVDALVCRYSAKNRLVGTGTPGERTRIRQYAPNKTGELAVCSECGRTADANLNAAKNIRQCAVKNSNFSKCKRKYGKQDGESESQFKERKAERWADAEGKCKTIVREINRKNRKKALDARGQRLAVDVL